MNNFKRLKYSWLPKPRIYPKGPKRLPIIIKWIGRISFPFILIGSYYAYGVSNDSEVKHSLLHYVHAAYPDAYLCVFRIQMTLPSKEECFRKGEPRSVLNVDKLASAYLRSIPFGLFSYLFGFATSITNDLSPLKFNSGDEIKNYKVLVRSPSEILLKSYGNLYTWFSMEYDDDDENHIIYRLGYLWHPQSSIYSSIIWYLGHQFLGRVLLQGAGFQLLKDERKILYPENNEMNNNNNNNNNNGTQYLEHQCRLDVCNRAIETTANFCNNHNVSIEECIKKIDRTKNVCQLMGIDDIHIKLLTNNNNNNKS